MKRTPLELVGSALLLAGCAGCYSTWDLNHRQIYKLDGFRAGETRELTSTKDEPVEFTNSTALRLVGGGGIDMTAKFDSIRIDKSLMTAIAHDEDRPIVLDLNRLSGLEAKNYSPSKTAGAAIGLTLGISGAIAGISVAIFAATFSPH